MTYLLLNWDIFKMIGSKMWEVPITQKLLNRGWYWRKAKTGEH